MGKHLPKVDPICYGCGASMDVAPQSLYEQVPKKHRPHILWVSRHGTAWLCPHCNLTLGPPMGITDALEEWGRRNEDVETAPEAVA